MKTRVHYVSPKGSAEQLAEIIARTCECVKEPLLPAYMPENITLMFLGCEGNKPDKVTMEFINVMNSERVRNVALFSCTGGSGEPIEQMKKALKSRGVNVLDKTLTAPVKGLFGGGPKESDLAAAKQFAQDCMDAVEGE